MVADAGGAARAVEAMKAHLVDVEVCRMGAAVLYAPWQQGGVVVERLGESFSHCEIDPESVWD